MAAVLILAAGAALLGSGGEDAEIAEAPAGNFSGSISCVLDREASIGAQGVADMSFTASGSLCVNERTLYAPIDNGARFRRAIVLGEARALDVLTIDPRSGEFRRERYLLDDAGFAAANRAVAESRAGRGCQGDAAIEAVEERNETLMRFARGEPSQRLIWRCEASN